MPPSAILSSARDRLLCELAEELHALEQDDLLRRLAVLERVDGPNAQVEGREVVSWCSNDYLGLASHPALVQAAAQAMAADGVGSRASRLLAGSTRWHQQLEGSLAAWFQAEQAIVYSSGYLANLGTLSALLSSRDAVFVDRLAHASLFDAARATRATLRVFRHNDPEHARQLLLRAGKARRRVLITEGVFSMDGDRAPLAALMEAAESHDALVYLDDAHGAFVLGAGGRGSPEAAGIAHERFLYMGTLGKALGAQGGFVVGPATLVELLRNRARTFIYTTALAVPVAAAAAAALKLLAEDPAPRAALWQRAGQLHARLAGLSATPLSGPSHLVPVLAGSTARSLRLAEQLWQAGHWIPAIRPPTVPAGTARLRISLTSLHTESQVNHLADTLHSVCDSYGS